MQQGRTEKIYLTKNSRVRATCSFFVARGVYLRQRPEARDSRSEQQPLVDFAFSPHFLALLPGLGWSYLAFLALPCLASPLPALAFNCGNQKGFAAFVVVGERSFSVVAAAASGNSPAEQIFASLGRHSLIADC